MKSHHDKIKHEKIEELLAEALFGFEYTDEQWALLETTLKPLRIPDDSIPAVRSALVSAACTFRWKAETARLRVEKREQAHANQLIKDAEQLNARLGQLKEDHILNCDPRLTRTLRKRLAVWTAAMREAQSFRVEDRDLRERVDLGYPRA